MNYFLLRRARAAGLTNPELYLNFPLSRVSGIKTRERFTFFSDLLRLIRYPALVSPARGRVDYLLPPPHSEGVADPPDAAGTSEISAERWSRNPGSP